jgi:hypothetical protein
MSDTGNFDPCPGTQLLNLCGCRLLADEKGLRIGIFSDLDCPEVRQAIENIHLSGYQVIYLDRADVPPDYRNRRCPKRNIGESFQSWKKRAEWQRRQLQDIDAA